MSVGASGPGIWPANELADKPEKVMLLKVKVSKVVFSVRVPEPDPVLRPPPSCAPSKLTVKFCARASARLDSAAARNTSVFTVRQGSNYLAELMAVDPRKNRTKIKLLKGFFATISSVF